MPTDEERMFELIPVDGRGIGNETLRRQLTWDLQRYEKTKNSLLRSRRIALGQGRGGSVKRLDASSKDDQLFRLLSVDGTATTNSALREKLRWPEDEYYLVRDRLVDEGVIALGRGRGGLVRRVLSSAETSSVFVSAAVSKSRHDEEREETHYEPVANVLKDAWGKDWRLNWWRAEIIARQGSKSTGGRWSRPDLAVVSLRKFLYLPGVHLDVWTFEVKILDALDVTAVYEALSHSRFATRVYVLCPVRPQLTEEEDERIERVRAEAARHRVGFITATSPGNYDTWIERAEAPRRETAPEDIDDFIRNQLSADTQSDLQLQLHR